MIKQIEAPQFQNWSCHGCAQCCRGAMVIPLTDEDKRRIESQGWTREKGVDPATMIEAEGGGWRLGHQPDGACVFLDGSRCRIHAQFGESAKPRACRMFPMVFHPAGKKLLAGLRLSCPSAAANQGAPLCQQQASMLAIAREVVPDDFSKISAPAVLGEAGLEWPDFLRYAARLDKYVADASRPMAVKLRDALLWLDKVRSSSFDNVSGADGEIIFDSLADLVRAEPAPKPAKPSFAGRLMFRTLVFTYLRRDTVADLSSGATRRLAPFWAMLRFTGSMAVPAIPGDKRKLRCADVERSFGPIPADAEALLTRFFRLKIQSLHFCGRAYYDYPLTEGFQALALLYAVILWLARRRAAADSRTSFVYADFLEAVQQADHHHGYNPVLGQPTARHRLRLMAQRGDIVKLLAN